MGVALLLVLAALASVASAANHPFTRGDATALFYGDGGPVVTIHNPSSETGAFEPGKRIGPGQNFDGFHVCATDWHVMFINLILLDSTDHVHNVAEAKTVFATINVTYELDGAPLAVQQTSVQPYLGAVTLLDPNATVGFHQKTGAILAPDALSVGPHTENVRVFTNGSLDDLGPVTFYVDAAGTGACM
ncbi:MAG TPA: hypothetical protein VFK76_00330 [Gaiellaceae bacterium]|nr:hypothetical protein [Gaiellaceae bacterium]